MGDYKSCSMCGNCKGGKVKVCQLGHKIKSFQWIANCPDWQPRKKDRPKFEEPEDSIPEEELERQLHMEDEREFGAGMF